MKDHDTQPWVGLGQLTDGDHLRGAAAREFPSETLAAQVASADAVDLRSNRRDFLKMMGFGVGAAAAASACDIPRKYAVPYVVSPEELVPGVAAYYASTYVSGNDYCPVLVKTREGRPIKIEGNPASGLLGSGTTSRAQASVLSLYDTTRLPGPVRVTPRLVANAAAPGKPQDYVDNGELLTWGEVDALVEEALTPGARIRVVTNTVHSPTLNAALAEFTGRYPGAEVVTYDTSSASAAIVAHQRAFGRRELPGFRFDRADVVVGIECDFLGSWLFPSLYNEQYARRRRIVNQLRPAMNRHYQVESTMTMTGSNADHRVRVKPSHIGQAIIELHNQVAGLSGRGALGSTVLDPETKEKLAVAARDLVGARGAALVVSGSNNLAEQRIVAAINDMLGAYGSTIDTAKTINLRGGIDADMQRLIADMNAGRVDAVIFTDDVNPAFDYPNRDAFVAALANVKYKLSTSMTLTETSVLCDFIAPENHNLESWGDAEPIAGIYTVIQPTIHQLWDSRQLGATFLSWAKSADLDPTLEQPYLGFLRKQWESTLFGQQSQFASFDAFWDMCLSNGVFQGTSAGNSVTSLGAGGASASGVRQAEPMETLEICFPETVAVGHGQYANNPWLQEVPDPVTRTTWGNYLQVPVTYTEGRNYDVFLDINPEELKGKTDEVTLTSGDKAANAYTVIQFGMAPNTVALGTGYGRMQVGRVGRKADGTSVGTDIVPFLSLDADGNRQYYTADIAVAKTGELDDRFAMVQYHHTMGVDGYDEGEAIVVDEERTLFNGYGGIADGYRGNLTERSIIRHAEVSNLPEFTEELIEERAHHQKLNSHSLYEGHDDAFKLGHHWGMYVDLNACTGCQACVVACIAENNTPVVGKNEVARHHEMTWPRIDRYGFTRTASCRSCRRRAGRPWRGAAR